MKKIFLTLAAVGALAAAAAPAVAQPYGYDGRYDRGWDNRYDRDGRYDRGWDNRYDRGDHRMLSRIALERVGRAADSGALNPWEARRLTAEARDFYQWEARAGGDGLSWRERQISQARFDRLMAELRHDVNDRDYGYGYYR